MNLLEVNNICKTYGSGETAVKALKNVSFSVPKGEYVAIVGESGSGKSTCLLYTSFGEVSQVGVFSLDLPSIVFHKFRDTNSVGLSSFATKLDYAAVRVW